ncbi:hypothetical protein ACLM5J_06780 [Nocardioides sp. Bht2]|uniref:hypothetical protein n=1 Tax=Nocardioides sp. Bht2 TaxID=3392297 RepID=UPI0039B3C4EF
MVVITKVVHDHILAFPVTTLSDPSCGPSLVRQDTPLGVPLTVWTFAETGLGLHLLDRRLGNLISARTVELCRLYGQGRGEPPLDIATGDYFEHQDFVDGLLEWMQSLCFHEWPTETTGDVVLNADVMEARHLRASDLVAILGLSVPDAAALRSGNRAPTAADVIALANSWGLEPAEFLTVAADDGIAALLNPRVKPLLRQIMEARNTDESGARGLARSQFALATRSVGGAADLMDAALRRLLNDDPSEP